MGNIWLRTLEGPGHLHSGSRAELSWEAGWLGIEEEGELENTPPPISRFFSLL